MSQRFKSNLEARLKIATDEQKKKILKSGLFLVDENHIPIALFQLTPDKVDTKKTRKVENIPPSNLKILCRNLAEIAGHYLVKIPYPKYERPEYQLNKEKYIEDFEESFLNYIEPFFIDKAKLEPQLKNFLQKAKKQIAKEFESVWGKQCPPTNTTKPYRHLILPMIAIFQKYLSKYEYITDTDVYYYVARILIECGLENGDQKTIGDRIRRYWYRHYKSIT